MGEVVEVDLVNVEVRASDAAGRPVTGLRQGDFRLLEDGRPVTISHFAAVTPVASGPATAAPAAAMVGQDTAEPPAAEETPGVHLLVYFDDQHLAPAHRATVLRQLRELADEHLAPDDLVSVVTEDMSVKVRLPFSTDRAALDRSLAELASAPATGGDIERALAMAYNEMIDNQRAQVKLGDPCGMSVAEPIRRYAELARDDALRTLGHLRFVVNSLAGLGGRKALLYVSDGIPLEPGSELYQAFNQLCGGGALREGVGLPDDLSPNDTFGMRKPGAVEEVALDVAQRSLADELSRLAAHANAQGVSLYTLQASGLKTASTATLSPDERLLQVPAVTAAIADNLVQPLVYLASETGGRALLNSNDYVPDLVRMREDLSTYYSLAFVPAHHGDGKEHSLAVEVSRRGVRLDYRRNYRDKPPLEQAVDRTLAALVHGFADNPLEVILEAGAATAAGDGTLAVPLHLKIPLFRLSLLPSGDTFAGKLRLLVATSLAGGEPSPLHQVEVPVTVPRLQMLTAYGQYFAYDLTLHLQPGSQRVAVAVRDEVSAIASYLSRSLEVASPPATTAAAGSGSRPR